MAIPTDGLVLDFNPALAPEEDGAPITTIAVGGLTFAPFVAQPTSYVTDALGQRALDMATTQFAQQSANGFIPVTCIYLFAPPAAKPISPTLGTHHATLSMNVDKTDPGDMTIWSVQGGGSSLGLVTLPATGVRSLGASLSEGRVVKGYVNGLKKVEGAGSPYPSASTPAFLGVGRTYRTLWWDRALSEAEMLAVDAELREPFIPQPTIAWTAPAHLSSPVLGYQVSTLVAGKHTVVDLGPEALSHKVRGSGFAEVRALTKQGLSAPAQVGF